MNGKSEHTTEMIAYLYAVERKSPAEIMQILDCSDTTVWRHLEIARGTHKKIKLPRPLIREPAPALAVSERDRERIRMAVEEASRSENQYADLVARLQAACPCKTEKTHWLKGVWVVPLRKSQYPVPLEDGVTWDRAASAFGRAAAARVAELLRPARRIGIAWGRTLQSVTESIAALNLAPRRRSARAVVFPVNGDFLANVPEDDQSDLFQVFTAQTRLSPSFLAAELATALNGTAQGIPSLSSVPSIVPLKWNHAASGSGSEADVIKRFIREIVGYTRIFGTPSNRDGDQTGEGDRGRPFGGTSPSSPTGEPQQEMDTNPHHALIDEMDALLVAVGSSHFPRRVWYRAIVDYLGTTEDRLRALTFGDIGAVLVPRRMPVTKEFQAIQKCYTGIQLTHIEKCVFKARAARAPGVIAFGVGASRCRIMIECIRRGLVNHIVIDNSLAEAIKAFLDGKGILGE